MTESEQRNAATLFYNKWHGKGDEKSDSQRFWIDFFENVLGIEDVTEKIVFEKRVNVDGQTKFIDVYIPETRVLIEQKSIDKDLSKKIQQSDGSMRTPFEQGRNYAQWMIPNETPLWIVACNFKTFEIHDMNKPKDEPTVVPLEEVRNKLPLFDFMFKKEVKEISHEVEISVQAGNIVGQIYDALLEQYADKTNPDSLKSLNKLCVRLVFCMYAEDSGLFGNRLMFHDYMSQYNAKLWKNALTELFKVLDTKIEDRDKYLEDDLAAFPYVNGGLFAEEDIEIPRFTDDIVSLILEKGCGFDWSEISPTIFGAVFESTLNPETRRSGGMHYTSIENIHKVINPLFLDDLKNELKEIQEIGVIKQRKDRAKKFQNKLSALTFLDPACGSGNFLTESYISLRKLENEAIMIQTGGQISIGEVINPIQVSIGQFYGIEINDFAVTVAKTALWIAEHQMMKATEGIVHMSLDFLPLKSYANIVEGNALRLDWESVVPKGKLDYIMGNPPFVGYSMQSKEQKSDILSVYVDEKGKAYKTAGKIDYVSAWYFKASKLMQNTNIHTAFVSTNSITQGEQVAGVWKPLYDRFGIHIDFAHRTFRWDSEASLKAHVHCVIVGFSVAKNEKKYLFEAGERKTVRNINAYLMDAPNVFISSQTRPICDVPQMVYGNKPTDGGYLFLSPDEYNDIIKLEPTIQKYIRRIYGATEYINNKERYCLWLVDASPADLRKSAFIKERIEGVYQFRINSAKEATRKSADTPSLFQEIRQPNTEYIIIPRHSSENRRYIPFGFVSPEIIVNDAVQIIPGATLYHFGIMMSNVHMAWVRAVCGRIKSDYRYSKDIVYNNFPWCNPTEAQKAKIEQTAQGILDARALYPDSSLADLYDELSMPRELRKAHQLNDKAIMEAYGFSIKDTTEEVCVAKLMEMYQELTK